MSTALVSRPAPRGSLAGSSGASGSSRRFGGEAAGRAASGSDDGFSMSKVLGTIVFSTMVGLTGYLAWWQGSRYYWKVELIKEMQAELDAVPSYLPLAEKSGVAVKNQFGVRQVVVAGKWLTDKELLVGPRSPPREVPPTAYDAHGYFVVTPLQREDGSVVLVNRGWYPSSKLEPESRQAGLKDVAAVVGVIGEHDEGGASSEVFASFDLKAMARVASVEDSTGPEPILVHTIEDFQLGSVPVTRPLEKYAEFYVTPMKHAVYCATWSSLSVCGALLTWFRFIR